MRPNTTHTHHTYTYIRRVVVCLHRAIGAHILRTCSRNRCGAHARAPSSSNLLVSACGAFAHATPHQRCCYNPPTVCAYCTSVSCVRVCGWLARIVAYSAGVLVALLTHTRTRTVKRVAFTRARARDRHRHFGCTPHRQTHRHTTCDRGVVFGGCVASCGQSVRASFNTFCVQSVLLGGIWR